MKKCNFKTKFYNYVKKDTDIFECDEDAGTQGFCIYHDEKYDDKQEISKKFNEKIKRALVEKKSLFCIGYILPEVKVKGSFLEPVYFTKANFGKADFSGSNFQQVDFSGATFQNANFSNTQFNEADFFGVNITGKINFSKSVFNNKVNFSESFFKGANFSESHLIRAHFLGCKFEKADFDLSKIEKSDFFGAIFQSPVTFVGAEIKDTQFPTAKFLQEVYFTGTKMENIIFLKCVFDVAEFDHSILKLVDFHGATFQGNVNFTLAELEKVDFFLTIFEGIAQFFEATLEDVLFTRGNFQGFAKFEKTKLKNVKFSKAEFKTADFIDTKFEGKNLF